MSERQRKPSADTSGVSYNLKEGRDREGRRVIALEVTCGQSVITNIMTEQEALGLAAWIERTVNPRISNDRRLH